MNFIESHNFPIFPKYDYDYNIFEQSYAQGYNGFGEPFEPYSFVDSNFNYKFMLQKEDNDEIFEDPQKSWNENNQTFKKSIENKSTGLSETNEK